MSGLSEALAARAKLLAHRLPHSMLMSGHHLWWNGRQSFGIRRLQHKTGLSRFDLEAFARAKRSHTLVVLGSGGSINEIRGDRWAALSAFDTFGFNFWLFHDHVPTFYAMEDCADYGTFRRMIRPDHDTMLRVLTAHHPRDLEALVAHLPCSWSSSTWLAPTTSSVARSVDELRASIRFLNRAGYFAPTSEPHHLYKYRATLSMIVTLGVRLGYERIVLCGVDLNRADYFFSDRDRYPLAEGFRRVSRPSRPHETNVASPTLMAIDTVILALDALVLKPRGVALYIENPTSALVPRVPHLSDDTLSAWT